MVTEKAVVAVAEQVAVFSFSWQAVIYLERHGSGGLVGRLAV